MGLCVGLQCVLGYVQCVSVLTTEVTGESTVVHGPLEVGLLAAGGAVVGAVSDLVCTLTTTRLSKHRGGGRG